MKNRLAVLLALLVPAVPAVADEFIDIQGHPVWVDSSTTIVVDDEVLPPGSPIPQTPGLRAEARFPTASAAQPGPHGVVPAATIVFSYAVRGSVTSTNPLRVLGQEVTVTADTGSTGLPGGNIGNIALGDHLDVSGYVDTNSSLLASYIEYLPTPTPRWLLSGYVTAVNGAEIMLGPQRVSLAGVSPIDCGASVDVGEFLEIRADAIPNFTAGSVLDTVTRLTCVVPVPLGTPGALGALTGIVGTILSNTSFQFGPYAVSYDANTEFRFGSADDLAPGAAAEIDGVFGPGLTFVAQGIQFDAPIIRIEGPVFPADVVPGGNGTVHVLANTVRRAAQLRDEDLVYANGINQARQVEVRGYLDRQGNRWATRARLRGGPDAADSRAVGPVDSVNRPLLSVLGLTLDTTAAVAYEDPAGNPIDADTFFLGALPGAIVEQNGAWDGVGTLTGGVVALIMGVDPPPPEGPQRSLIVGRFGGGDRVFADGFD
ncbi:DUF5666 domain-containing protein [Dokdonella immobilis]|uniref:DUF5666 domain-containing protein n=1 Tax=Dokdonella immobilis TaxID=578942 RepID=A0A1I4YU93_9GAMM|nr:DUF5666 domain-containing protein [Dokdonella immobilis]SFN41616.1 hypothetical protein SAMN05216289_12021 [Dokdonella immobilis]